MRYVIFSLVGLTLILSACGGSGNSGTNSTPIAPTIAASSPPDAATGTSYPGYTFAVASGGTAPFTWSPSGTLPPGLDLSSDGQLTGSPVTAGTFAFTVTVTDSSMPALTASVAVNLKINNSPIVFDPTQTAPVGVHGTGYWFAFSTTGGSAPLSWTITAGALPPGLALGSDGTVSGTPTAASATPYSFTVTATDSYTPTAETASMNFSITISEPPPPTISGTSPPTAIVGTPYSWQFSTIDGLAPFVWTPPIAPMGGLTLGPDGILGGTPTAAGIYPVSLTVTDALNQISPATPVTVRIAIARPAASFTSTGDMTAARDGHTSTLLLDGRVLIAGGGPANAELYDPASQTFTASGSTMMTQGPRSATLLEDSGLPNYGKVLLAGGNEVVAELFDPATGAFTVTGSTLASHLGQTATLLQNGQVLIAGGETAAAELYDPSTGTFTATGSMTISRTGHTATRLPDGRVLIAGGVQDFGPGTVPVPSGPGVESAEIYDPASGTFTSTGSMSRGRAGHTATLLADGTVLIVGNDNSADQFDPGTGMFSVVGAPAAGSKATATLRKDGTVLVAGGTGGRYRTSTATASFFAPESGGFVATGPLVTPRDGHAATLLLDGTVLITGGTRHSCYFFYRSCSPKPTVLSSAELYK
jgi:Putative Ig domain